MSLSPQNDLKEDKKTWNGLLAVLRSTGIFIVVGILGAMFLLWCFHELTEGIFRNQFSSLDNNILLWLHGFTNPVLDVIFGFFTTIGSIAGVLVMVAIVFGLLIWKKHFHSPWLLALAVGGGILINQLLKFYYERPRPDLWANDNRPATFSFPSGHATVSFCFFVMLIWLGSKFIKVYWQKVIWFILMIICILMVGLSRLYFGVHYPTDVLGGYISAGCWLTILLIGVFWYDRWQAKRGKVSTP